jgi:hypothetical protein
VGTVSVPNLAILCMPFGFLALNTNVLTAYYVRSVKIVIIRTVNIRLVDNETVLKGYHMRRHMNDGSSVCYSLNFPTFRCTKFQNLDRSHIIRCQYVRAVIVSTLSEALIAKKY